MKENGKKQGAVSPCAACKLLRRRCAPDCVFAPHFPAEEPQKFANVHRVFGASNVNKMLQELPMHQRSDAVSSMVYEANARVCDPVYGCVGAISSLQQQINVLQAQLALAQAEVVHMRMRQYGNNNNNTVPHHHHHHNHHEDTTPENSPPSKMISSHHHHHQSKSLFSIDMCLDQPNMEDSLWSC